MATLYAFWTSSCSWRVRAALTFKCVPFLEKNLDIVRSKHHLNEEFTSLNPMQKVPALEIDGVVLVESMAILQYLDETRPAPALQPKDPLAKAKMREICEVIVSGIQPLQNIGLKPYLSSEEQFNEFTALWVKKGFGALERMLIKTRGEFCVGNDITFADLCLVPQVYNAVTRFKMDLTPYPTIDSLYNRLLDEDCLKKTHPLIVKKAQSKL